jgi:hypothetical protein
MRKHEDDDCSFINFLLLPTMLIIILCDITIRVQIVDFVPTSFGEVRDQGIQENRDTLTY